MDIQITGAADLGPLIRAVRKQQKMRQDDTAGLVGVSENFLGKVERGAESVQWGKLFQVLDGLGIRLSVNIPDETALAALSGSDDLQKSR